MARRPRRRHRPKTISGTAVTGQKGVKLIEQVVLNMESSWTPTGALEVGIDGYIELFDPATRKPLGLTLAAQKQGRLGNRQRFVISGANRRMSSTGWPAICP